ncbi:helix-turn-helix transcriptional regulator [Flavobacterium sp. ZT3R18]|uniref:helix-turn-helix domain-containing protein n=1 Tax=Flavobacterium sp. ZT3R18 TaxID=2594429 RepID=UPI00117A26A0|nr:AraC family transcriptional regulator [Flavobacterium sp. ZT3R18]TRX32387.1 helix-turn-helix transcriptional regulator [Flavobacterium sp. ZT3R18]
MNIQHLPNDLNIDTKSEVQIFDYQVASSSIKNKVMLNTNVFSFLLEGTKELITQDKPTIINKDSFLLIKSGNCLMTENLSETNVYRSVLFFFNDAILLKLMQKNKLPNTINSSSKPYEIFQYDDYIHHFVKSLIKIKEYDNSLQNSLLQTKFEEILTYLLHRNGPEFLNNILPYQDSQSRHFTAVVESNKLNNLTIQELSFLCNMSISTFKRNFEQHYQTSPIKWFQEKRLEYSVYLLNIKKKRPIDIYSEIGFESLSSFTQAFKVKYNTTPKQFQLEK